MSVNFSNSTIKLNDVRNYIISNVDLQLSQRSAPRMYIQGPPGCGKSMIIEEICRENGWALKCQYISNCALEYLTGLPCKVAHGETVSWSKPAILNLDTLDYRPDNYIEGVTPTIILFDDFHLCDRVMQRYMFQLLTYKGLNDYQLDNNVAIILAGNRNNDKAGAMPIPAPVCNRMMFVEVGVDATDWLTNFAFKNNVRDDIMSFIHNEGEVYLSMTPIESTAWASPRSWTFLSNQMDAYEKRFHDIPLDVLKVMANGELNPEATAKFITYRELFAKWNFDELCKVNIDKLVEKFANESKKNPTAVYAIISAVVSWMIRIYRENNYDVTNATVKKTVTFAYNVITSFLTMRVHNVNPVPMVIAGMRFIYMYQNLSGIQGKQASALSKLFIAEMQNEREIDYIFLELIANIFKVKLSDTDIKKINDAKKNLKYNGQVIE